MFRKSSGCVDVVLLAKCKWELAVQSSQSCVLNYLCQKTETLGTSIDLHRNSGQKGPEDRAPVTQSTHSPYEKDPERPTLFSNNPI